MKQSERTVLERAEAINDVLRDCDVDVSLSVLNFCMGTLIRDQLSGDERALRISDEQTRFIASVNHNDRLH